MSAKPFLEARIDADVLSRVLLPAIDARILQLRQVQRATTPEQIELANVAVALRRGALRSPRFARVATIEPKTLRRACIAARKVVDRGR